VSPINALGPPHQSNHFDPLNSNLAALYGVETRVLNQAVKRNLERFPADFMFQLSASEPLISIRKTAASRRRP